MARPGPQPPPRAAERDGGVAPILAEHPLPPPQTRLVGSSPDLLPERCLPAEPTGRAGPSPPTAPHSARPAPAPRPRHRQKLPGSERRPAARCCPRWWPMAWHLKGPRLGPGTHVASGSASCRAGRALLYRQVPAWGPTRGPAGAASSRPAGQGGRALAGTGHPQPTPGIHARVGPGGADGLLALLACGGARLCRYLGHMAPSRTGPDALP